VQHAASLLDFHRAAAKLPHSVLAPLCEALPGTPPASGTAHTRGLAERARRNATWGGKRPLLSIQQLSTPPHFASAIPAQAIRMLNTGRLQAAQAPVKLLIECCLPRRRSGP
jgi:hypothetical protein